MKIFTFILCCIGFFFIFDIYPDSINIRSKIKKIQGNYIQQKKKRKKTAKEIVELINGKKREGIVVRNINIARQSLEQSGQKDKLSKVLKISIGTASFGVVIGLIMHNLLLSVVLGIGLYFLPIWMTQFSVFTYEKFICQELEVSLNMITMSYMRENDIVASIRINLDTIKNPVRQVFMDIVNKIEKVGIDPVIALEQSKAVLNNGLYDEWCNALILCVDDHTLKDTLRPIVDKFAELKAQQEENETLMMMPFREIVMMVGLVLFIPILLYFGNKEWFGFLAYSLPGQISMAVTFIVIFFAINKAIKLAKPIDYNI